MPRRVLIVDDDPGVRDLYRPVLEGAGYEVLTAASGAEANRVLTQAQGAVDVMILDIGLPDTDGAEISRAVAARWGAKPALFVTGFSDEYVPLTDAPGTWLVMQKPIPVPELLKAIRQLVGAVYGDAGPGTARPGSP